MKFTGPIFIAIAAFLWSTDALFRQPLTGSVSSTAIVFLEHLFGLAILLPWLAARRSELSKLSFRQWLAVLGIGVGGSALATVMFTAAFSYVGPSVAILLQKIQPLIAIVLAVSLLRERLRPSFWIWSSVAIGAAYVVSFPNFHVTWSLYDNGTRGVLLALGAAGLWGASTVLGRYVISSVTYPTLSALRFTVAAITLFLVMLTQGELPGLGGLSAQAFFGLVGIVLVSGTTPILLYYRGLRTTRASIATVVELIFPLSAVVLNWIFLGDKLVWQQIAAGAIMVFAVVRIQTLNRSAEAPDQRAFAPVPTAE